MRLLDQILATAVPLSPRGKAIIGQMLQAKAFLAEINGVELKRFEPPRQSVRLPYSPMWVEFPAHKKCGVLLGEVECLAREIKGLVFIGGNLAAQGHLAQFWVELDQRGLAGEIHSKLTEGFRNLAELEEQYGFLRSVFVASLHLVSMLHAKNVGVVELPSEKRSVRDRLIKKVRRTPGVRFHTLEITTPGAKAVRKSSKTPGGRPVSWHTCRGHFRDCTENGLFGDPTKKGLYWIPSHARGSRSAGVVEKDYRVTGPQGPQCV